MNIDKKLEQIDQKFAERVEQATESWVREKQIVNAYRDGKSLSVIGKAYGISRQRVHKILNG